MENETGEKITVFQKMFLSTLGLTTDKTVQTILDKSEGSRTISDKRGKRIPGNKISDDISDNVNSHMLSFNPSISHYRKEDAPNKLYISREFNVSMMQQDFRNSNQDIRFTTHITI